MVDSKDNQLINISISEILNNALSSDKVTRQDAENKLSNLALRNFPEFLFNLATELADESKPIKSRQMAATYIKNSIFISNELKDIWVNKIDPTAKDQIKNLILSTLATKFKEVRAAAGLVLAGICRVDLPLNEKWPTLIASLCQSAYHENINIRLAAIESLGYICEELTPKTIDPSSVDTILSALIQNINQSIKDAEIVRASLKAFFHTIKLAEKNFSRGVELNILMEAIFLAGNSYADDDNILERIALIFIEIASISSYYDYIFDYVKKISEFTFYLAATNDKLALLAFEFWCSLGDEEVNRFKAAYNINSSILSNTSISVGTTVNKPNKNYFTSYYTQLTEIIILFISNDQDLEDDEDLESWTLSKASSYILHLLVQVIDSEKMEFIMQYIERGLPGDDLKTKNISLLLFTGCCDSLPHRNKVNDYISRHLKKILNFLSFDNQIIRKSAALLLTKITKFYGKSGIFDAQVLSYTVPSLVKSFHSKNKIAILVLQSLINLTKAVGDLDTQKGSNLMSPYFETIFSELVNLAYREGAFNKDENLTMHCFLLINELIEYSSHDKQEKLGEILIYFLSLFEGLITNPSNPVLSTMCAPGSSDVILQLQSYYCSIFRTVFKKLTKKITNENASKIYLLLESAFKLRQGVFEEAILAFGSLASNMDKNFDEIMNSFQNFLLFALEKYEESSLSKSAIITLGHIVRAIKSDFSKYSDKFIPVLINILTNENVSRTNKTLAITTLGEICMSIDEKFLPYLKSVMEVFFSAATLAISQADQDDEDTEEYLKDLRFELIEAFTCISFGLDDCGNKNLFASYVPDIFRFMSTIMNDNYTQRPDILKSMLAFIADMANSYGKEIKAVCDKEFVKKVIAKLRSYKIKRIESDINQQEENFNRV